MHLTLGVSIWQSGNHHLFLISTSETTPVNLHADSMSKYIVIHLAPVSNNALLEEEESKEMQDWNFITAGQKLAILPMLDIRAVYSNFCQTSTYSNTAGRREDNSERRGPRQMTTRITSRIKLRLFNKTRLASVTCERPGIIVCSTTIST